MHPQPGINDDAKWLFNREVHSRIKAWVILQDSFDACDDGAAAGSELLHFFAGLRSSYPFALTACHGGPAVKAHGQLAANIRQTRVHAFHKAGIEGKGLLLQDGTFHFNTCSFYLSRPLPFTAGLGSVIPKTSRTIPASITASAQGPVLPVNEHGSRHIQRCAFGLSTSTP